jgi:hypothetical protein
MSPRKTPIQVRTGKASSVIISFRFFLKFKFFFFYLGPLSSTHLSNSVSNGSRLRVAYQVKKNYFLF